MKVWKGHEKNDLKISFWWFLVILGGFGWFLRDLLDQQRSPLQSIIIYVISDTVTFNDYYFNKAMNFTIALKAALRRL
ncbi:hypothetical protein, partial [Vibrio sp. HI00D65]|uniref:hypothetical protein n=1 Tax=Vibrio sp. HI00D65 TaxID=1822216 RepID=UPI000A9E8BAE